MTDLTAFGLPADLPDIAPPNLVIDTPRDDAPDAVASLSPREKAAIIVRTLIAGGTHLSLTQLPNHLQISLARTLGGLEGIDKAAERGVVAEFLSELESGVAHFGSGLEGALSMLDGALSKDVMSDLSGGNTLKKSIDPWPRLAEFPPEKIAEKLQAERAEVCAVCLSKLPGGFAAAVLSKMDGTLARRAAFSVSRISDAKPDAVRAIGRSILTQLTDVPNRAFNSDPAEIVGSMLLAAKAATREDILGGLKDEDAGFADRVREEIFVFADIPARIETTDIPKILRGIDQGDLLVALGFSQSSNAADTAAAEFILDNMSKRMAESLREELEAQGAPEDDAGEEAQQKIVEAIRDLETSREIKLIARKSDADSKV